MVHKRGRHRASGAAIGMLVLVAGTLGPVPASATTLYKWVDENGVVHYSDQPHPGAEKLQVAKAQTYSAPPPPRPVKSVAPASAPAAPEQYYQRAQITSPSDGDVFVATGGRVPVAVDLEPGLASGHQLWLSLDGVREDGLGDNATEGTLSNVERGSHTLTLSIADQNGNVIATDSVAFTVRQPTSIKPIQPKKP